MNEHCNLPYNKQEIREPGPDVHAGSAVTAESRHKARSKHLRAPPSPSSSAVSPNHSIKQFSIRRGKTSSSSRGERKRPNPKRGHVIRGGELARHGGQEAPGQQGSRTLQAERGSGFGRRQKSGRARDLNYCNAERERERA
ncbi:hypothetical protein Mp_4g21930 [Marchantia polymorpha subsp. ruderalis]|uniref:Uncharacterized protein n=2 Tax=Marchantia polymorpha TaxID=3197 RepID=A0AAF6BCG4_MARPO|nr:hypothetical protein MARPO_0090s0029 [Marchantia polymorpha]BBN09698.1 hypothetical protein Mp_4g21930 [Marchantia polymorpha subsp. ruderalis]|eukprot:PTQ33288.1 hypothetical protein MARPO_0090s0029 [Marchantia polymorpha]